MSCIHGDYGATMYFQILFRNDQKMLSMEVFPHSFPKTNGVDCNCEMFICHFGKARIMEQNIVEAL